MNGVEILASNEVVVEVAFNWTAFGIVLGVSLVISFMAGVIVSLANKDWTELIIPVFAGLMVGVWFGGLCGESLKVPATYETQYKVTISDEVQMNDFLEKYEIVNQEGKIYTVRERLQK